MEIVKIHTNYITLADLLKFAGLTATGGHSKIVILEGLVKVNGEVCTIRGKKLRGGEIIEFDNITIKVSKDDI
jgi:ribosome-associated protein